MTVWSCIGLVSLAGCAGFGCGSDGCAGLLTSPTDADAGRFSATDDLERSLTVGSASGCSGTTIRSSSLQPLHSLL